MKFFVFGTLKKAHGNNHIMQAGKAKYLGDACTVEPYIMAGLMVWPRDGGRPVRGEVWEIGDPATDKVAARTLKELDRLENNGRWYERRVVPVRMLTDHLGVMPLPRDAGDVVEAWLYEGMAHNSPRGSLYRSEGNVNCDGMFEWSVARERLPVRAGRHGEQEDA